MSDFFDDGMNRFERRRDFRDVVGVEDGVGSSLESIVQCVEEGED